MGQGRRAAGHPVDVASGAAFTSYRDVEVPGQFPLRWDRFYSTALLKGHNSPLGIGWTNRFFCTLERHDQGFRFVGPEGDAELFADPDGSVDHGGVVRSLGSFQEITRHSDTYVVTRWRIEAGDTERFVYRAADDGLGLTLASIEDDRGHAIDLFHENKRLIALRQRLERRTLIVEYSTASHVGELVLLLPSGARLTRARYRHDDLGRLVAATDALEHHDLFEYDDQSRLTREINKDGAVFSFGYDERGRCVFTTGLDRFDEKSLRYRDHIGWTDVTNSRGGVTKYQWLPNGQVTAEIDPIGGVRRTEYDDYGRIAAVIDPLGARTAYAYDEMGNRCEIDEPGGRTVRIEHNLRHQPVAITDPAGRIWRREYDEGGRQVAAVDPLGRRWVFEYDGRGTLVRVVDPAGAERRFAHAANGDVIEMTDWAGNPTLFAVDEFGRVVQRTDAVGAATRFAYDALGRCLAIELPEGAQLRCEYDAGGNLTKVWNHNGQSITFRFGTCGRLLRRADALGHTVRYAWGTEPAQLERITNELGEHHQFVYDAAGRLIREAPFDGRDLRYEYDAAGRCIASVNGLGERVEYEYNDLRRVVGKRYPDGTSARFAYDIDGNVVLGEKGDSRVSLERDSLGRLVKEIQDHGSISYEYDTIGNVSGIETSLGCRLSYTYDPRGIVTALRTGTGDELQFSLNAVGLETSRQLPGGLDLHQRHSASGHLVEQRLDPSPSSYRSTPLLQRSYLYDSLGNLVAEEDRRSGVTQYAYDPAERLVRLVRTGDVEQFRYDGAGNITYSAQTAVGTADVRAADVTYLPGSRVVTFAGTAFEYDANGRLSRKRERTGEGATREWRYEWDADDELVELETPEGVVWRYRYDAFGRRVAKETAGTRIRFVWDREVILHQLRDDQVEATWLFDPDSVTPLAKIEGRRMYSVVADHIGTPRELVSSEGKIVWAATYRAWGEVDRFAANQVDCPVRFGGQWFDAESGLHYSWFRYYDPAHGHFLTADPIGIKGGLNERLYAPNPVNWFDPWGLTACGDDDDEKPVVITISRSKYPQAAQHIADNGPVTGRIDRPGAAGRRRESLRGKATSPGMDRDEVPPAVLSTGGAGASVRLIPASDNRGAGSTMGHQMRDLPNNTLVTLVAGD